MLACLVVLWRVCTPKCGSVVVAYFRRLTPRESLVRLCAVALVPLYAAQLVLDFLKSRYENVAAPTAWLNSLPIPVYYDGLDGHSSAIAVPRAVFVSLGLGVGLLETAALAVIVVALQRDARTLGRRIVLTLACAMAALSLLAPVLSTTDPYEYVATGMLGLRAYAPPHGAFFGTVYEAIDKRIPLTGVIYGPLWVLIDTAQTAFGSSIYQKIEAIRISNVGFIATALWLLARSGLSRAALVAFALNPALWYFSVAVPHADIEGISLLAAAFACACRSRTWPAAAFLIAAGLVKLPFVIAGGAILAPLGGAKRRCCAWFAAIAIVFALSYALPGNAYLSTLWHYAGVRAGSALSGRWLVFGPVMALFTLLLVTRSRGSLGIAWLFHQMAPIAAPWYLFWGMPYALASAGFEIYLVAFPFAATQAALVDTASYVVAFVGLAVVVFDLGASRHVQKHSYSDRIAQIAHATAGEPPAAISS